MLVNANYTWLKCTECGEISRVLPGQKFNNLDDFSEAIKCDCLLEQESNISDNPNKHTSNPQAIIDLQALKIIELKREIETVRELKKDDIPEVKKSIEELREEAKALGIKSYGSMKEETLRARISNV